MSILKKNTNQQQRRRGGEGGASSRRRARPSSTSQDEEGQQQNHDERHVKFPTSSNGDEDQVVTNVVSIIEPVAEEERAILWYTPQELKEQRVSLALDNEATRDPDSCGDNDSIPSCDGINADADERSKTSSSSISISQTKSSTKYNNKQLHPHHDEINNNICLSQKLRRKEFMEMFLAQQYEQRQMGIVDPKGLFQFSKACSKQARLLAVQHAKQIHAEQEQQLKLEREQQRLVLLRRQQLQKNGTGTAEDDEDAHIEELAQNLDDVLELVSAFETHLRK